MIADSVFWTVVVWGVVGGFAVVGLMWLEGRLSRFLTNQRKIEAEIVEYLRGPLKSRATADELAAWLRDRDRDRGQK